MLEGLVRWARRKSPWILHFNSGGCNGCDIELLDALTPRFDVERLGRSGGADADVAGKFVLIITIIISIYFCVVGIFNEEIIIVYSEIGIAIAVF